MDTSDPSGLTVLPHGKGNHRSLAKGLVRSGTLSLLIQWRFVIDVVTEKRVARILATSCDSLSD